VQKCEKIYFLMIYLFKIVKIMIWTYSISFPIFDII